MAGWKKNRMSFEDIQQKTKEEKSSGREQDARMWKPHQDKDGSGYAVIRFLPPAEGQSSPWAKIYSHGFEGKGWYINNCATTLGKDTPCPVCEANRTIVEDNGDGNWTTLPDRYKTIVRKRKRNLSYYYNILVLKDDAHPENEGKVFIYRTGVKIFDKIMDAISPKFEDETPINPFDFIDGADFKLKIRKVDGNTNYDKSEFANPSALCDGDEDKLQEVYDSLHDIASMTNRDQFPSYEDAKKRMDKVLGLASKPVQEETTSEEDEDDTPWATKEETPKEEVKETPKKEEVKKTVESVVEDTSDDEVDDAMAFFANMED